MKADRPARAPRANPRQPAKHRRRPGPDQDTRPASLAATPGPDPATPLNQVRLVIGTVIGAHGTRGEIKLRLETDEPDHLPNIQRVFLGEELTPRHLLEVRFHGGQALLRIAGIETPEAVDAIRGLVVRIAGTDARPLETGEFFLYQLIGLTAIDEMGTPLGHVTDVMSTGANDVFVLTPEAGGPHLLLPHHPDVILAIRPEEGQMVVRPLVYRE